MANGINKGERDVLQLLGDLIKSVSQKGKDVSQQLLVNPLAKVSQQAGALSTFVPGKEGEGKRILSELNDINDQRKSTLSFTERIDEEESEKRARKESQANLDEAGPGAAGEFLNKRQIVQPPQIEPFDATSISPQEKGMNLLEGLLSRGPDALNAFLGGFNVDQRAKEAQIALAEQELAGEKPLQRGEREKIGLQGAIDLQKEIVKRTLDAEKAGTLKPNEIFTQYRKASIDFEKVRDAQSRIEASAENPSAAGDLALIFNFMKVLDPGSTVREGEFANAENSRAASEGFRKLFNKIVSGQRLTAKQRKDFVSRSRGLFKRAELQQTKTNREFGELARRNGIDPRNLLIDVGIAQPGQQATGNKALALAAKAKGAVAFDTDRNVFINAQGNPIQ